MVASGNDRLRLGLSSKNSQDPESESRSSDSFKHARENFEQAIKIDPELYTAYVGLAYLYGEVEKNYERSITLQKRAIALAQRAGSTVSTEVQAELLKNLAVALTKRAGELGDKNSGPSDTVAALNLGKQALKELAKAHRFDTPRNPLKPLLRYQISIQVAMVHGYIGDKCMELDKLNEARDWYRSALIDTSSALQEVNLLEPSGYREKQIQICEQFTANLKKTLQTLLPSKISDSEPPVSKPRSR